MSPTEKVKEAITQGNSNPADIAQATGLGQGDRGGNLGLPRAQ